MIMTKRSSTVQFSQYPSHISQELVRVGFDLSLIHDTTIVSFTGHRPDKLGGYSNSIRHILTSFMHDQIFMAFNRSMTQFSGAKLITGMAQGLDTAVALAARDLPAPYEAAIPFVGQDRLWPTQAQRMYQSLLTTADKVTVVRKVLNTNNTSDIADAMDERNHYMVDNSHVTVALWNGTPGGTANCIRYCDTINHPWVNLWAEWVEYKKFRMQQLVEDQRGNTMPL